MKIMKSQAFSTGTKFIVTEKTKDNTFGPGTTGFISYIKGVDQDFRNVIHYRFVAIKRGKTGKERLEICDMSTPVFDIESEKMSEMMPDEKRKYFVHVEPLVKPLHVNEMTSIDFLGWALAYTKFVRKLSSRAKEFNPWPGGGDLLDTFLHIENEYADDPESVRETYTTIPIKKQIISKLRIMESTLMKCSLSYMQKVAEIESTAANTIHKLGAKDVGKEIVEDTMKFYGAKHTALTTLIIQKGKGINKKMLVESVSWS
jgi:hypothetical protein